MRKALGFLTPLPFGDRTGGAPTAGALYWFPLVGIVVGAIVGGVWWAAGRVWPLGIAAILAVGSDAAATGMLHLDGLADSADGLLPPFDRARRLAVMKTPDIGAFGAVVVVLFLLLRAAAFGLLNPLVPAWTVVVAVMSIWVTSRAVMAGITAVVPYARADADGGLASAFLEEARRGPVVAVCGLALMISAAASGSATVQSDAWGRWWVGPICVLGVVAGALGVVGFALRRIGGFTGDVVGAAGVVGETVGLLLLCARW